MYVLDIVNLWLFRLMKNDDTHCISMLPRVYSDQVMSETLKSLEAQGGDDDEAEDTEEKVEDDDRAAVPASKLEAWEQRKKKYRKYRQKSRETASEVMLAAASEVKLVTVWNAGEPLVKALITASSSKVVICSLILPTRPA